MGPQRFHEPMAWLLRLRASVSPSLSEELLRPRALPSQKRGVKAECTQVCPTCTSLTGTRTATIHTRGEEVGVAEEKGIPPVPHLLSLGHFYQIQGGKQNHPSWESRTILYALVFYQAWYLIPETISSCRVPRIKFPPDFIQTLEGSNQTKCQANMEVSGREHSLPGRLAALSTLSHVTFQEETSGQTKGASIVHGVLPCGAHSTALSPILPSPLQSVMRTQTVDGDDGGALRGRKRVEGCVWIYWCGKQSKSRGDSRWR